ncbi:nucleotide exchange factor GrpE [Nocardioides sp. dk4132]|uniref:nucleotide exchange factor GrpE n=1 Tax=unclassified Nocardioides TaxID=2615069 RepID=UPI0012963726|nr:MULTISPECIES: nucleotide exchange factor GrpE [unclassified Nocardioides]MQW77385.1 nucleotide exchange factor GrpE [Nocardioides sp. dk4132]QGA09200.1 nucleotide exchange factor GrpE [Nocardioides sp. dk884]
MTDEHRHDEGPPGDPAREGVDEAAERSEDPAAPAAGEAPDSEPAEADPLQAARDEVETLKMELGERTSDLQRLQAEFLNYKRRVDRDRELVKQNAAYVVLAPVVEVLDTIDRAREHAELEGGFKAVAEQLERVVANQGLEKFGVPGDPFDPSLHEALSHLGEDPDVDVVTCKVVAKAGYRMGDRVVRAAQVLVVDPAAGSADPAGPADEASES